MFTSEVLFENEFNFTHFTTGQKHSAAIDDQGRIYLWGSNGRNQLGVENSSQTFNITGDESTTYVSVALGDYHTIALRDNQRVVSWGQNMWGDWEQVKLLGVKAIQLQSLLKWKD